MTAIPPPETTKQHSEGADNDLGIRSIARWLALVLTIAAANYVAGRLGLLLALPPGFATAVWPPSGIALGALLLFGYRVWPGVWLGSFAINIFIAAEAAPITDFVFAAGVAAGIATGSTVQAIIGTWLIYRFVGRSSPLLFTRDIALFLLLGGPVSCLVAASVGVGTLVTAGIMLPDDAPYQWWTWWIGDSIGVLTVTPLILIALGEPRDVWHKRRLTVGLPLLLAFTVAVVVFVLASRNEESRIQAKVQQKREQLVSSLQEGIERRVVLLRAAAGLFESDGQVSRHQFRRFLEPILPTAKGTQGVGWNPKVPRERRAEYELAARADGLEGFEIYERVDGVARRAGDRDNYFPAYYLEPQAGNKVALGFDLYSNPARRITLERARDSGRPAVTEPLDLVQETGSQKGVLIVHPVYGGVSTPDTVEGRRDALSGFAVMVFRIGDMVSAATTTSAHGLVLALEDADAPPENRTLLPAWTPSTGAAEPAETWEQVNLAVADRSWTLKFAPTALAVAEQRSLVGWTILAAGLLLASLLGALLLAVTGNTIHVQRLMEDAQKTLAKLRKAQTQLVQAEKLASLGSLVAGISHEVNTPLGVGVSAASTLADYVEAFRRKYKANEMRRSDLDAFVEMAGESSQIMLRNMERAAGLMRSFKQVAVDQSSGERRRFELDRYIDQVVQSLAPRLKKTEHRIEVDCQSDILIDSYPGAFAQILTNLISNSLLHAFEPGAKGFIKVRARVHDERVLLSYRDDGGGIEQEHLSRMFDPFYTTKRGQGGSGLGLHIVHNLVYGLLGGRIEVQGAPGKGLEFLFNLPRNAPTKHTPAAGS